MTERLQQWLHAHKIEVAIFMLALIVRLVLVVTTPIDKHIGYGADGSDYTNEAINLVEGHGFSRATTTPYVPDAIRTPLYPMFIASIYKATGSVLLVPFVEAILGSFIPLIGMAIVRRIVRDRRLALAAGLVLVFEPHTVFYTTFFASEGISIVLLYLGIWETLRWYQGESSKSAALAGVWLALSALARPITAYVPLAYAALFSIFAWVEKSWRITLKQLALFVGVFVLIISPWLIRNYVAFGTPSMATVGWFNVYTRLAATVVAIDEKKDFYPVYHELLDNLARKGYVDHAPPVSELEVQGPEWEPILRDESLKILAEHKRATVIFATTGVASVLFNDNTLGIIQDLTGLSPHRPPFSPTLYISQHGLVAGIKAVLPYLSGLYVIPYIMNAWWLALFVVSIVGFVVLWRHGKRFEALLLLGAIAYSVVLTLNAGAQIGGRYRVQFLICELALAAAAIEVLLVRLGARKK